MNETFWDYFNEDKVIQVKVKGRQHVKFIASSEEDMAIVCLSTDETKRLIKSLSKALGEEE